MDDDISFSELVDRSLEVIHAFEKVEKRRWGVEGAMIEMQKQVGELAKYIMSQERYYLSARDDQPEYQSDKSKIADELSDILLMVIMIADHYKIDLAKEHMAQMDRAYNHPSMDIGKH